MAQTFPLDEAGVISTSLEGILYGFSVLMFIGTVWTLLSGRSRAQMNFRMVVVAFLLLTLSTIHIVVDIKRIYSGLVLYRDTLGGPPAWFANEREPSFIFKNMAYAIQTALGDGVVIYRSYMVWRSVWVIIVPFILWLGVCATGIGAVYEFAQPAPTSSDVFASRTGPWIASFYAITLSCNFIATGLLAYKLWTINRSVHGTRVGRGLVPVLLIIIDAGALYSFTLLAALISFLNQSNATFIVLDMIPPIISIAFYMVILRVGLAQSTPATSKSAFQRMPLPRNETRPMQVHIEQLTEVDHKRSTSGKEAESREMARIV
ncbi:hypothetical protein B0H13DRAFT_2661533 [Mycena leptocephala]|nr:hypothetical protein B0H13DRAFT_2661533 [Mycena leptocephala]